MDINKDGDKGIQKAGFTVTAGWGWGIDGPTPIGWTKVYALGTKVRLLTFNYSSFEQMPSFRNSRLSQGICYITDGKRSDPRIQLPYKVWRTNGNWGKSSESLPTLLPSHSASNSRDPYVHFSFNLTQIYVSTICFILKQGYMFRLEVSYLQALTTFALPTLGSHGV